MSHAIMRIQKIKSMQGLAEREKHNTRRKTVLSADGSNNISVEGWSYVNILDTKSQTFLCCTSS